jgi:hypothetical protein
LFQKTKKQPAYPKEASAAPVLTDRQADKTPLSQAEEEIKTKWQRQTRFVSATDVFMTLLRSNEGFYLNNAGGRLAPLRED